MTPKHKFRVVVVDSTIQFKRDWQTSRPLYALSILQPSSHVYNMTQVCNWLALEEVLYKRSFIDRFDIIGDAAHSIINQTQQRTPSSPNLINRQTRWRPIRDMAEA
ncbi:hypothetical protein N7520_002958 [Penicillium odoratum]|uniref:uncharacterized protein n=1 Tax=Penicillium odoratum TaxID=1167516 RepID=UPI002546B140|nr:uncharacterized protein N7520_002958 [Penicillium odoratum]KAJ5772429.1 hypothetical protein N7520_002958 [Penicillium odoratum]